MSRRSGQVENDVRAVLREFGDRRGPRLCVDGAAGPAKEHSRPVRNDPEHADADPAAYRYNSSAEKTGHVFTPET